MAEVAAEPDVAPEPPETPEDAAESALFAARAELQEEAPEGLDVRLAYPPPPAAITDYNITYGHRERPNPNRADWTRELIERPDRFYLYDLYCNGEVVAEDWPAEKVREFIAIGRVSDFDAARAKWAAATSTRDARPEAETPEEREQREREAEERRREEEREIVRVAQANGGGPGGRIAGLNAWREQQGLPPLPGAPAYKRR